MGLSDSDSMDARMNRTGIGNASALCDPRPLLPIPRDAAEESAMRAAWHAALEWSSDDVLAWTLGIDGRWRCCPLMASAAADRLIRCRPEWVESEQPAPSGALYRLYAGGKLQRSVDPEHYPWHVDPERHPWHDDPYTLTCDIPHVAALMAKMEAT